MQRYVEQLIEDLEALAKNPPATPYLEVPENMETIPDAAELALVSYKTMEDWTRFDASNFPEMIQLEILQIKKLNAAIFSVFESLFIEIIDIPDEMPEEWLYEVLRSEWDNTLVQYLPSSGMDLEFCTNNWKTCPYGEYCDCYDEVAENEDLKLFNVEHANNKRKSNDVDDLKP